MSVNTITIDFWNTIVIAKSNGDDRQAARIRGVQELGSKYNSSITEEQVQKARKYADDQFEKEWLGKQRTQPTYELISNMLEYLAIPAQEEEIDQLVEIFQNSMFDGPPDLAPGVDEALQQLYQVAPLVIISDTMFSPGKVLRSYLREKRLYNYFHYFVFSDEIGVSKPHFRAFEKALATTGTPPHESVHIGDIDQTDIVGAQNMGMKSILYTGVSDADAAKTSAHYVCPTWKDIVKTIQHL